MSHSLVRRWSRLVSPYTIGNCGKRLQLLAFSFSNTTTSAKHDDPSRPGPPPIRVGITESAGRGVFATRGIGAGDLIHTAKPFLCHPSLSAIHSVCYFCLRKLGSLTSPKATGVSFCSEQCKERSKEFYDVEMKVNWMAFDNYCRYVSFALKQQALKDRLFQWTRGLKYPFLVKRLACMVISGVASIDCLDILKPATLTPEMILKMEEGFALLRNAFAKTLIADENIGCIRINAFRVDLAGSLYEDLLSSAVASVEAEAAVGNAVYILPSFYNHDCDPNAHIIWIDNADAKLKALRNVEAGEELRICYIDASLDRGARQELLLRGYGFQCNCNRCLHGD